MRYLCVHCDHRFEAEGDTPPRRCPSCMRATGVQPVRDDDIKPKAPARRSPAAALGLAVVAILAAVGGYFVWGRRPTAGEHGALGPASPGELTEALDKAQADGELRGLLAPDAAIAAWAKQHASGATPYDRAQAITRVIRERASALAFVPWSLAEPRQTEIATAAKTLAMLQKDKGRAELYPLEVAALMVAGLRSVEVPALIAELPSVEGERAPLDPSGYLGYFAVAVYPGEAGLGTPRLFDPYGGRTLAPGVKPNVLSDAQAVGAALAVRAMHEATYRADPRRALATSSASLQLAGTLPSVRTARGMVVMAGRQLEQGLSELAAARQLRADAARLHNLAGVELLTGDIERASKDLAAALERSPDFAAAHATLGSLAMMRGDNEQAERELETAERLAPDLSMLAWARAEQGFRTGDRERALESARKALAARPSFDAHLRMGMLLREAARFDELRALTAQLLKMTPEYRQGEVREMVKQAFGAVALDADAQDPDGDAPSDAVAPAPGAPRLEEPQLRLRGGDSKFKLNLSR